MSDDLKSLVSPDQYRVDRAHLFESPQSFKWFMRKHRRELEDAGAIKRIAGRDKVDPSRTDAVVSAVGDRAARTTRPAA